MRLLSNIKTWGQGSHLKLGTNSAAIFSNGCANITWKCRRGSLLWWVTPTCPHYRNVHTQHNSRDTPSLLDNRCLLLSRRRKGVWAYTLRLLGGGGNVLGEFNIVWLPRNTITKGLMKYVLCLIHLQMAFTISENYANSHTPPDAIKASLARPQSA